MGNIPITPGAQVIEHKNMVAIGEQTFTKMAANKTRTARHEVFHCLFNSPFAHALRDYAQNH
jgi:hypothetical protein